MKKVNVILSILAVSVFLTSGKGLANVAEGRALLFNAGNPLYSKVVQANDEFKTAIASNPDDPEANFFCALTRIVTSGMVNGSGGGVETIRDFLELFGLQRTTEDVIINALLPPYEIPVINEDYDTSKITTDGETVRAFISGPFAQLITLSVGNLKKQDANFNLVLRPEETGGDWLDVDYGDVLLFRAGLQLLKFIILVSSSYDISLDAGTLKGMVDSAMGLAPNQQLQQLLDSYPQLLQLLPSANGLPEARNAFLAAVTDLERAVDFIRGETDIQSDDLISFRPDFDPYLYEAKRNEKRIFEILDQFRKIAYSLIENRSIEISIAYQQKWRFELDNGTQLEVDMIRRPGAEERKVEINNIGPCDALCSTYNNTWQVIHKLPDEKDSSDKVIIIVMGFDSQWYPVFATFSLSIDLNGDFYESDGESHGTYSLDNALSGSSSGTFTAELLDEIEDVRKLDLNLLFGNTGKPELNIRDELPQFDSDNRYMPQTLPENSVLKGIWPPVYHIDEFKISYAKYQYFRTINQFFSGPTIVSVSGINYDLLNVVLKDQFGDYPSEPHMASIQMILPDGSSLYSTAPSHWTGLMLSKQMLATYDEANTKWNFSPEFSTTAYYPFMVPRLINIGTFDAPNWVATREPFPEGQYEITVFGSAVKSDNFSYTYSGQPVVLPNINYDSIQISWQNSGLVFSWTPPDPSTLPGGHTIQQRVDITAQDVTPPTGWIKAVCSPNHGELILPPKVIGKLADMGGDRFRFMIGLQTADEQNYSITEGSEFYFDLAGAPFGNLKGRVKTMLGDSPADIAGATITIPSIGLETETDENGQFVFYSLPKGNYTVSIQADGFYPATQEMELISGGSTYQVPSVTLTTDGLYTQDDLDVAVQAKDQEVRDQYDINGDGLVGLPEAIRALQTVTGVIEP